MPPALSQLRITEFGCFALVFKQPAIGCGGHIHDVGDRETGARRCSVRLTSQVGQGVAQYCDGRARRRDRGHERDRRACWCPREDSDLPRGFGAEMTPKGVG